MATRLFFPDGVAAAITPPVPTANWEHINATGNWLQAALKVVDASALTTVAYNPDGAEHIADNDSFHRQYVVGPLAAQTFAGNVTGQFQATEVNAGNNLFLTLKVITCSAAGVLRNTLLAITRSTGNEYTTTLRNATFPSTALAGSQTCQDGDYLVIEVGLGGLSVAAGGTQTHNGSIRWGCSASSGDLPVDNTQTGTTYRPWVEFSTSIQWQVATESNADTASLVETFAKRTNKLVADAVSLVENFAALKVVVRAIGDSVSLTEAFVKQINKRVAETVSLTESRLLTVSRGIADTIGFTESLLKTRAKATADTVALAEAIALAASKRLSETAGLSEQLDTVLTPAGGGGGTFSNRRVQRCGFLRNQ